jgi:hypothetical protein
MGGHPKVTALGLIFFEPKLTRNHQNSDRHERHSDQQHVVTPSCNKLNHRHSPAMFDQRCNLVQAVGLEARIMSIGSLEATFAVLRHQVFIS